MSSWYDAWADRYGDWSTSVTADVPFYVGLARDADGPLVELAVGNGRVAIPVAQATGRRVIGIDSSQAMLAQARVRAVEEGVELDLREGDIRELEIEKPAALIYCPGRSLLHLPTWADRRRCFERVAASLRSNGRFAWNAFAFDHHVASAIDGQHADTPGVRCRTRTTTASAITESTSPWTMVEPVRSGGQPRTNGWGSSTSRACASKLSMADSPGNRSTTTAVSTSSWPVGKRCGAPLSGCSPLAQLSLCWLG